ncbi:MAG: type II toxin-antitoxin system HicA family toxin [Endomicrobium sp.]|jgi:predicted RNA binding protein YcfA (HicA-like mRNA interferase family)|nr:type II toxin-antitoxin system HicA family toxin [Endomicrobium sp.]
MTGIHTVKLQKLRNFLKHYNFKEIRQKGSHLAFTKEGLERPIIIAVRGKEVQFYVCKQIIRILEITEENFLKELKKY